MVQRNGLDTTIFLHVREIRRPILYITKRFNLSYLRIGAEGGTFTTRPPKLNPEGIIWRSILSYFRKIFVRANWISKRRHEL